MAYQTLIVETEDHIASIQLNRPDSMNALNAEMLSELAAAVKEADASIKVRVIVITGSDKVFAAGADISEMVDKTFVEIADEDVFGKAHSEISQCRKPIIAAVKGYCLGGGCELAMLCDFIIAGESAKFGQPEINLGVIPAIGGSQRLTRVVGKAKAMEMCLTGRFMDAKEAESSGLVSRVVPDKDLVRDAMETAAKIVPKSTLAVRAVKESINRSYETTLQEGLLFEQRLFQSLFATEDQTEGMTAFIEKRSPRFRGK